jgi:hypothetical protein
MTKTSKTPITVRRKGNFTSIFAPHRHEIMFFVKNQLRGFLGDGKTNQTINKFNYIKP